MSSYNDAMATDSGETLAARCAMVGLDLADSSKAGVPAGGASPAIKSENSTVIKHPAVISPFSAGSGQLLTMYPSVFAALGFIRRRRVKKMSQRRRASR